MLLLLKLLIAAAAGLAAAVLIVILHTRFVLASKHKPETLIGSHSGAPVGRQDLSKRLLHAESSPRLTAPVVHALSYLSAGCYALDAEMWADVPALARSDPQDHKRRGAAWAS
jgi:hypothetical protein